MGIFDLSGPEFLAFYAGLLAVATPVALLLRRLLRRPAGNVDVRFLSLHPVEVAYLAGGDRQAITALVASLAQRKLITVGTTQPTFSFEAAPPPGADNLERRFHNAIGPGTSTIDGATALAHPVVAPLRQKLLSLGLLVSDQTKVMLRAVPTFVLLAVLTVGLIKIAIGISRDRPVGFLIVLCLLVFGATLWQWVNTPQRSLLGDTVLRKLRASNAGLQQTALVKPDRLSPEDLGLAVALFGVSAVRTGPMAGLARVMERPKSERRHAHSSSGCSSCGSGCGGGSCGGGCGGGCGGCGS